MKILVVVDQEKYSEYAAREAARLAVNTWSDVTILGVQSPRVDKDSGLDPGLAEAVCRYRKQFVANETNSESPYGAGECGTLKQVRPETWEMENPADAGKKRLRVLVRKGDPSAEILDQARKDESDFIVIGSSLGSQPGWLGVIDLPQKISNMAPCSVLVVKEEKMPSSVVCCLDHDNVSQESLEMINQLVTLHQADLKLVGLSASKVLKQKVDTKMNDVLNYYSDRGITTWIHVVDADSLNDFIGEIAKKSLVGLWLGKKSFLQKIFSPDRLAQLIKAANSSVLILK